MNEQSLRKVPFALLAKSDCPNEILNTNSSNNNSNNQSERNVSLSIANKATKRRKGEISSQDDVATGNNNKYNMSINLLSDIEKVKEIGKKTRERLHDEKSRRKEIVRLENVELESNILDNRFKKNSIFSTVRKTTRSKRNHKISPRNKDNYDEVSGIDERKRNSTQKIDSWVPPTQNIVTIHRDLSKDQKSNIVRLHGLPINVTSDHIRKFFSGLSPQKIFILPSLHVTIKDFDIFSDEEWNERTSNETINENYAKRYPNHFRVFVKFSSYLVADNAISRSGEVIHADNDVEACIAITPLSKRFSSHLQKYMAIPVERGKKLEDVLHEAEAKIPTIVNELIWLMAHQKIGLDTKKLFIGGNDESSYPMIETRDLDQLIPPSSNQRMEKMIAVYNTLCDLYDELEKHSAIFMIQDVDLLPSTDAYSSAHHLTKVSFDWIIEQLDTRKKCLDAYQYQMSSQSSKY